MYCSEINDIIDLAQPSVSHHLKQLTDAELVIAEKEGREVKYSLNNKVIDQYVHFLLALKV
jgi:ArsR family transcriptional regulator